MATGEMISGFYTYKPTIISVTITEAIKQFEGEGFIKSSLFFVASIATSHVVFCI